MKNAITVKENGMKTITPKDGYILTSYMNGDETIRNISAVSMSEKTPEPKSIYAMKLSEYQELKEKLNQNN